MIRAWVAEGASARAVPPETAVQAVASESGACAWIDFEGEGEAAAATLLKPLAIHPLVLEDMVMEVNRPKVDSITAAQELLPRRPELLSAGPSHLVHFLLDVLVDHYLPIMDRVAEEIDAFEECVFDPRREAEHAKIIRLKRGMSALRRIVGPQRDTVLALTRDEFRPVPSEMRPYLRDVYDRLARVNDLLESYRDEISTVLELHVAMVSNRLNEVIKRLTVIATMGLPLTVVTSYYGMNFDFHEYHTRHAHLFALSLLLASAGGTLWYLKRRRWL